MDSDSVENMSHLKPCLSENGSIKATDDVSALIESMQKLKSVSGRSLVVNILKSTAIFSSRRDETKEVLKRFISQGGWELLGAWFSEAIEAKHYTFLTHFVETLSLFPISIDLLRVSAIPKSLKVVTKFDCKPLQLVSRRLLITWKKYVKDINQKNKSESEANKQATFLDSLTAAIVPHQKSRKRTLVIKSEDESTPIPEPPEPVTENQFETVNGADDKPVAEIPEENVNEMDNPISKRRRVSFKEDELVQVFTFEMTDQERAEMHGERPHLDFNQARHLEFLQERNALTNAKLLSSEPITREWVRSAEIDQINNPPRGENSVERGIQLARESNILPPIYLDVSQIPISPLEPPPPEELEEELVEEDPPQTFETCQEPPVICIPYWENYVNAQKMVRKPYEWNQRGKRQGFKNRFPRGGDNVQYQRDAPYHNPRRRMFRRRMDYYPQDRPRQQFGNKVQYDNSYEQQQRPIIYDKGQHTNNESPTNLNRFVSSNRIQPYIEENM